MSEFRQNAKNAYCFFIILVEVQIDKLKTEAEIMAEVESPQVVISLASTDPKPGKIFDEIRNNFELR